MANRPQKAALCRLDEIEDGGSERLEANIAGRRESLIAVRVGERVHVYVNSCPHIGAPLDFLPGRFLNAERTFILCANHGALFRIEDGTCVHGPCSGERLEPIQTVVEEGIVFLSG